MTGMNFWHVFTMKLSDRSDSSSCSAKSCHHVKTIVLVLWPLLNILKSLKEALHDYYEETFQHGRNGQKLDNDMQRLFSSSSKGLTNKGVQWIVYNIILQKQAFVEAVKRQDFAFAKRVIAGNEQVDILKSEQKVRVTAGNEQVDHSKVRTKSHEFTVLMELKCMLANIMPILNMVK